MQINLQAEAIETVAAKAIEGVSLMARLMLLGVTDSAETARVTEARDIALADIESRRDDRLAAL